MKRIIKTSSFIFTVFSLSVVMLLSQSATSNGQTLNPPGSGLRLAWRYDVPKTKEQIPDLIALGTFLAYAGKQPSGITITSDNWIDTTRNVTEIAPPDVTLQQAKPIPSEGYDAVVFVRPSADKKTSDEIAEWLKAGTLVVIERNGAFQTNPYVNPEVKAAIPQTINDTGYMIIKKGDVLVFTGPKGPTQMNALVKEAHVWKEFPGKFKNQQIRKFIDELVQAIERR